MKKSNALTMVKWLSALFILSFLIFQGYRATYNPLSTESAIYYKTYDGIPVTGVIIRDEAVLTSDVPGVRSYLIEEGGRVAKNGIVAEIYGDRQAAGASRKAEQLDEQIKTLTELQTYNDIAAVDLDLLNAQVNSAFLNLLDRSSDGRYPDAENQAGELLSLLNRRQIVTGKETSFQGLIDSLKAEKERLNSSFSKQKQTIQSQYAGYFVSAVDGLEGKFSTAELDKLTPAQLTQTIETAQKASDVVGKVVADYEWYIAAVIGFNDALKLQEGADMTLKTQLETMPELPVTVKCINKGTSGDDVVVVFSCKYMNGELSTLRTQPMTILLKTYEGLRVSSKSIRVVDGQKGVYVLNGSEADFVPVNLLYSTSGYSICELSGDGKSGLRLYDEVIVKGKNLYDGKIVQ